MLPLALGGRQPLAVGFGFGFGFVEDSNLSLIHEFPNRVRDDRSKGAANDVTQDDA